MQSGHESECVAREEEAEPPGFTQTMQGQQHHGARTPERDQDSRYLHAWRDLSKGVFFRLQEFYPKPPACRVRHATRCSYA